MQIPVVSLITAAALLTASTSYAQAPSGAQPQPDPMNTFGGPPPGYSQPPQQPAPSAGPGFDGRANVTLVAPQAPQMVPKQVEKGGGAARVLGFVSLGLGITTAVGALGSFAAAKVIDDNQRGSSSDGLGGSLGGLASKSDEVKLLEGGALVGGISAGVLLGTSLILLLSTDAKHTETVYEPAPPGAGGSFAANGATQGPPRPQGPGAPMPPGPLAPGAGVDANANVNANANAHAHGGGPHTHRRLKFTLSHELPYAAYGITAGLVVTGVVATLIANDAAERLKDPENHPNPAATSSLRYAAGDTRALAAMVWAAAGVSAAWSVFDTYRAVGRVNASRRVNAGFGPIKNGGAAFVGGKF